MINKTICSLVVCGLALILSACATTGDVGNTGVSGQAPSTGKAGIDLVATSSTPYADNRRGALTQQEGPYREDSVISEGTGQFVNRRIASKAPVIRQVDGEVTLNFEAVDIRDVVKVIFDTLQENYVIDPAVQGVVTVQTSRPLSKELLIPTLEGLLRANNAALVRGDGLYEVVPLTSAIPGNISPRLNAGPGYGVRIFPLRYISAVEMEKILTPFAPEGGILRVDLARNLLMLSGTAQELNSLQETIEIFDVNWLEGMSVGVYRLQNIDTETIAGELGSIFGEDTELPIAGLLRFVPITQLNVLLVITPQPAYLKEVSKWIRRLDSSSGQQLYVYDVQNGDAEYLAELMTQVFSGSGTSSRPSPGGRVAPSLTPTEISSPSSLTEDNEGQQSTPSTTSSTPQTSSVTELTIGLDQVRIVADVANNALLIWSSDRTYEKILNALRKLDITPRQVLIEATIAEVTLSGRLEYGLQWFFKNNSILGDHQGFGALDLIPGVTLPNIAGSAAADGGFSYAITNTAGNVRLLLDLLASESEVEILSSPQILVIDNQEAKIRVGDQQPILTGSTNTTGNNTVSTQQIEFKDTGVLLEVRPQINAGGLVTMDINQEVIDIGEPQRNANNQNSFLERSITSKVVIQSGESIVLGGLIRDNRTKGKSGIPVLYQLPVVGSLFGSTTNDSRRTELMVLITPLVIENNSQALRATEELKQQMKSVIPVVDRNRPLF